jgi:GNAT superfamily N-acetyltransferase
MIRTIEELSLNAWPAIRQVLHDGWLLRFAEGYTRRSNSVSALYPGRLDLIRKIEFCERAYADRGLPAIFKLTAAAEPPELDRVLEQRSYRSEARTSVQCAELAMSSLAAPDDVRAWEEPGDEWIEHFMTLSGLPAHRRPVLRGILFNICCRVRFVALLDGGQPIACGMAVVQGAYVGLFDIVTDKDRRGQGVGTRLVQALLHWGRSQGATKAYLQVMLDNAAALRLYGKLGFVESYQYWYRVQ